MSRYTQLIDQLRAIVDPEAPLGCEKFAILDAWRNSLGRRPFTCPTTEAFSKSKRKATNAAHIELVFRKIDEAIDRGKATVDDLAGMVENLATDPWVEDHIPSTETDEFFALILPRLLDFLREGKLTIEDYRRLIRQVDEG